MNAAGFIAVELLFLAAAHAYGGPAWVVIGVLAFCGQAVAGVRLASLAILVPALGWLALSRGTGNRELFFPYCIYLASHVAVALTPRVAGAEAPRVAGAEAPRSFLAAPRSFRAAISRSFRAAAGGGLVVATFLAVRVLQRAGPRVLAVESIVAVAILAVVLAAAARLRRGGGASGVADWVGDAVIVVGASLAAYAGLAL